MSLASIPREFKELPIGIIDDPASPSRSAMDDVALDELVADIRVKGILEPLLVVRTGDRAEVVAGHRRLKAALRAGLVVVPCLIYPTKDAVLEGVKFSENRFREALSPADEALWFAELLERDCGGDVDRLCAQLGEKRSYVEGRLSLFSGDPKVFEALQAAKISIGIAHQLNRCTDQDIRRSFLHSAIVGGATVAIVSGWVQQWKFMQDQMAPAGALVVVAPEPSPIPQSDPFRCEICGKNHHAHLLKYLPVHDYCKLAILDPLLATYRGEDPQDGTGHDPRRT